MNGMEPKSYDPIAFRHLSKSKGNNSASMLVGNRRLLLSLIRANGKATRNQLAEATGLKFATVTNIVNQLLDEQIIVNSGRVDGGKGRSVSSFSIANTKFVLVTRITAVYVKVGIANVKNEIIDVKKVFFRTEDTFTEAERLIVDIVREYVNHYGEDRILMNVVSVEHRYKISANGYVIWDAYTGEYRDISILLYERTQIRVVSERSINLIAYGIIENCEKELDADHYMMVTVNLGYDLESAIVIDGRVIHGRNGRCGMLDRVLLSQGKQKYTSILTVQAILNMINVRKSVHPDSFINSLAEVNIRDVIQGYKNGDSLCVDVYDEVAEYYGLLCANIIAFLDPDVLCVGEEIPLTNAYLLKLRACAAKYIKEEDARRMKFFSAKERVSKYDPTLIGAAKYGYDLYLNMV